MTTHSAPGTHHERRLALSAPMIASIVVVVAAASLAVALIFGLGGGGLVGVASPSAEATLTASPSTTAAEPTPTPAPTPTPSLNPTPEPTPIAQWTGLTWSDPVTPRFVVHLSDLVAWGDGYVAVGQVPVGAGLSEAAFLTSADGLDWTVSYQVDPLGERYPEHLVVSDGSLFAFSPRARDDVDIILPSTSYSGPLVWRSTNGTDWMLIDSSSWEEGWQGAHQHVGVLPTGWDPTQYPIQTGLVDVASGPDGLVAIGNSFANDGLIPVVLHSTDGQNWSQVSLPAGAVSPLLNEVVPYNGGFVLVGTTDIGADPSTATPAAWFSGDGTSWTRGTVNVDEPLVRGTEMGYMAAGADGLVGWMGHREMSAGGPRFVGWWTSADGRTWQPRDLNVYPPSYTGHVADDGVRMVALPNTFHEDTGEWSPIDTAWVSTGGVTWTELALSAEMPDPLEAFWVVPDGVIYAGEQSFWFGTAVER